MAETATISCRCCRRDVKVPTYAYFDGFGIHERWTTNMVEVGVCGDCWTPCAASREHGGGCVIIAKFPYHEPRRRRSDESP